MAKQVDFNEFSDNYREIHTANIGKISKTDSDYFGEYKVKIIAEEEFQDRKVRILDLGCGDGINAKFFNQYFSDMEYVGIDISEKSVEKAKKDYEKDNIKFYEYDGKTIPYKEESFDIILVACVFHHISPDEHDSLLCECKRVLKSKGHMYIFEHNPYNPVTRKIVKDCPFDEDAILVAGGKMKKKLRKTGFGINNLHYTIFFPRGGVFKKLLWIEKYLRWLPLGGQYFIKSEK